MPTPSDPDDQESLHLARILIEEHGNTAARIARDNAYRLSKLRDSEGRNSWIRIARAVESLLAPEDAGAFR